MRERTPKPPGIEVGKAMNRKLALRTFIVISLLVILATAPVRASSQTTVYVAPSTVTVKVGQTFFVSIKISDVIDLYGWEFKLKWNPTVLDALSVTEGDFLKSGGDTFFWPIINNTKGCILVDCTLLGNIPGVNGSGTLVTIEFKAENRGESILDLYDTKLVNSLVQPIPHTANDGTVTVSKSVGGIIIPVSVLELLAPWVGLASTIVFILTTIAVVARRRKKK